MFCHVKFRKLLSVLPVFCNCNKFDWVDTDLISVSEPPELRLNGSGILSHCRDSGSNSNDD